MSDDDPIDDAIAENALGPKRVKIGNEEAEAHSLPDQIAAAKHVAAQKGVQGPTFGIRLGKLIPPGTG